LLSAFFLPVPILERLEIFLSTSQTASNQLAILKMDQSSNGALRGAVRISLSKNPASHSPRGSTLHHQGPATAPAMSYSGIGGAPNSSIFNILRFKPRIFNILGTNSPQSIENKDS
jgi:hypothetical protein